MPWLNWWKSEPTPTAVEWSVRRALHGNSRLRDFDAPRIRIAATADRRIVLSGAVSTPEARDLAEAVARRVPGVAAVVNELRTDADLTKQLRDLLAADPRLKGLASESVVFQGRAELRGSATYDAQLAAIKIAQSIDGVRSVENFMQLAVSKPSSDLAAAA